MQFLLEQDVLQKPVPDSEDEFDLCVFFQISVSVTSSRRPKLFVIGVVAQESRFSKGSLAVLKCLLLYFFILKDLCDIFVIFFILKGAISHYFPETQGQQRPGRRAATSHSGGSAGSRRVGTQGAWTRRESSLQRKINWTNIWQADFHHIRFLVQAHHV